MSETIAEPGTTITRDIVSQIAAALAVGWGAILRADLDAAQQRHRLSDEDMVIARELALAYRAEMKVGKVPAAVISYRYALARSRKKKPP
ncbi:MAG: hypothetical protein E5Y65_26060 [Mesorhizobium sp.]|uniref:hypothetical protein n=1 Tax=Mesorhizobium sp. TaxID=1871066 RepID=UPI001220BC9F|nr:hypothetical protein [Mesorhizobium sp.]TIL72276.1 MAG: hypothetical protein E5Y70_22440 [Mesorhizobium sp.]TIL86614.1 MAG: hypothetical protein E5Y65_26060 [Mesorhizobium sp.]TIL98385.1 MAG: hypothetical protein E5Y64_26460 [Mesorhizobium sp.]TIN21203.1 MAG: hypothetical protein E5Y59_02555 [Mesorhizobium sp.]